MNDPVTTVHPYREPARVPAQADLAAPFRDLRQDLVLRFPERQQAVDAMLAAVLASEHVLLLGPPGTAKSALSRAVARAFGGRYFERLLTKFSTPDELFGPMSLRALEQDRFERVTAGCLPEAEFAFLDETFKAGSAILNSMLAVMNERVFHNGGTPTACPLVTLVGASNELPDGRDMEALFDRFLVRLDVQYLAQLQSLREVLTAPEPDSSIRIPLADLRLAQEGAMRVDVPAEVVDALAAIRDDLQAEGIVASDRRWKKGLKLAKASAWTSGKSRADAEDLLTLSDVLWREPKERRKVAQVVGKRADPVGAEVAEVLESAREAAATVNSARAGERSAYIGQAAKATEILLEQKNRVTELSKNAGPRARVLAQDAAREIQGLYAEISRAVQASFAPAGLRGVS